MERCVLFHRQFPERRLNPTLLRKVYRMFGIKKKAIVYTKVLKPHIANKIGELKEQLRTKVATVKSEGYEVVYADECCFTRQSVAKGEWTRPRNNVEIDMTFLNDQAWSLLLGVS